MNRVELNRALGASINRDIWNDRKLELISEYFTDDFVADYSPRVIRRGHEGVRQMVEGAHAAFEGFRETVRSIIADENHIVVHFTISGRQVADWGPIRATGKRVEYPEIVIMRVREARVCHQIGVSDSLLALQQLGAIADPMGFARDLNSEAER